VETVDLAVEVREMAKLLKTLIPTQVELRSHFQDGLPAILADPTQIRQVIMNVIANAAEAMSERSGRLVVSLEQRYVSASELEPYLADAASPGAFLCLEVEDGGTGMDPETVQRVFDPFFTTKFKGRGLGMAAVLGIVRSHGGAIRIESREGLGTNVIVLFPAKSGNSSATRDPSAAQRGTILVVDDDDGVRSVARRTLAARGYHVLVASDGPSGLRLFEQQASDISLVLLDVTMPGMSGFEAAKIIRASGSRVPLLISSGYEVHSSKLETNDVSGILEKPYDAAALLGAVEAAIAGRSR
jgi:CheY-like chemotaxis protein